MLSLTVVADTNVLHSQVARDLLVSLGVRVVYCPEILREWQYLLPQETLPTSFEMITLKPFSMQGLPDESDEAILACAHQANADVLLTFNLRDFPTTLTSVSIKHPDVFFCEHSHHFQNVSEEFTARMNRARLHKLSKKLSVD